MRIALASLVVVLILVAPSAGFAEASVRQDSCIAFFDNGKQFTEVWFTVINFGLANSVCQVDFLSEPYPPTASCIMTATAAPTGWGTTLTDAGTASWFANTMGDCIAMGTGLDGFHFTLDPGFCCYVVTFRDATGAVLLTQEECFCNNFISVEESTWGGVKSHFRD